MIGIKRPSDNHFDASQSYQTSKRARTSQTTSPGRQLLLKEVREEPSLLDQILERASAGWDSLVSLFQAQAAQRPLTAVQGQHPSHRTDSYGGGMVWNEVVKSRPNGIGRPQSTSTTSKPAYGYNRNQPVDLTADTNQSDSSDDPLDDPIPNDRVNPGPSKSNVASSSRSHRRQKDGTSMQVGAERKGRKYGWEAASSSSSVLGGGLSSSNPISIDDDSESESEAHKSRRRFNKSASSHTVSALESQVVKLKSEIDGATNEHDRKRLGRVLNGVNNELNRVRREQAESKRVVMGTMSPRNGTDSLTAYAEQLHRQTSKPQDPFLGGQAIKTFVPRPVLRALRFPHHETGQDISQILEKVKIENEEKYAEYLATQKPSIPTSLPSEQAQAVRKILERPTTFKSPKCFNEVIEPGNIKRLKTGQWLSDDIMAYYAGLIMKRSAEAEAEKGKLPKIHYFNTFFYTKLASQGYSSLRRWTKKVDIFSKDMVLVPINVGNMHWIAAVINFKQRRIEYFDSMGNYGSSMREVFELLHGYIVDEHKDKKGSAYDMSGWKNVHAPTAPQQTNGSDCGVFSCQTLELVARGVDPIDKGFEFSSTNMEFFRQLMVHEISVGELRKRW